MVEAAHLIEMTHLVEAVEHTLLLHSFFNDMQIFWKADRRNNLDFKEQPSADLWQAHLLFALMAVCSAHLITMGVFRDDGMECNLSSALMGLFP